MSLAGGSGSVLARQIGLRAGTPASVAIVLPDNSCTAPCWHGIRPVVMSQEEGERLLQQIPNVHPYHNVVWQFYFEEQEIEIWFAGTLSLVARHIRLGDILAALGTPDYQKTQTVIERSTNQPVTLVYLYYEKSQIIVIVSTPPDGRVSVQMPLAVIQYPDQYYARPFYTWEWLGAIWLERYPPMVERD